MVILGIGKLSSRRVLQTAIDICNGKVSATVIQYQCTLFPNRRVRAAESGWSESFHQVFDVDRGSDVSTTVIQYRCTLFADRRVRIAGSGTSETFHQAFDADRGDDDSLETGWNRETQRDSQAPSLQSCNIIVALAYVLLSDTPHVGQRKEVTLAIDCEGKGTGVKSI